MYTANVYSVPQYESPQQDQNSPPRKSGRLLGCGIALGVISSLLCLWCFWIISVKTTFYINYLTICCCLYHIALSALAIFASQDVVKYRQYVLVCLGLSIFGVALLTTVTWILNAISWINSRINCDHCGSSYYSHHTFLRYACDDTCNYVTSIHLPVVLVVAAQGVLDVVIGIFNCLDTNKCCGVHSQSYSPGYVIQQQPQYPPNQPPTAQVN